MKKHSLFPTLEFTARVLTILFGIALILIGFELQAFAQTAATTGNAGGAGSATFASAEFAIKELCSHIMGGFGGLLMTASGVGAIVSGALGNYKASYSLLIVGIGAFTIPTVLGFYFPNAAEICQQASKQ